MPIPLRANPTATSKDYVQPVLTSYTTWSNNPTFGVKIGGLCNVRGVITPINNYRSDWGSTRELWWALSAGEWNENDPNSLNDKPTFYLTCGPGQTQGSYDRPNALRFTFEHPVKLEAFEVPFARKTNDTLNYTWSIYRVDVESDDTYTRKLLSRHVITRDDAAYKTKRVTLDIPSEIQEYAFAYDLELTQVNGPTWIDCLTFIRPDVKIRAKYTAQSFATTRGWEPVIGRLPDGYARCEYLQANQNGFIPTDITLSNNSSVEIVAAIDSMTNLYNGDTAYICAPYAGYRSPMTLWGFWGNYNASTGEYSLRARTYNKSWAVADQLILPFDTEKHTYVMDLKNKTLSIDENTTAITLSNTDSDLSRVYVWAFCRRENNAILRGGHKRIYSITIKENGVITHELVPALNAKGKACLYDINTGHSWYCPSSDSSAVTGKALE